MSLRPRGWPPGSGSASSRTARWVRISGTDRVPTHPAISSMASGRPSRRRHNSAMACGATSALAKPGIRSCALAMNSRTASLAAMSEAPAAAEGHSSGGTVQHTSPGTPSTTRLVTTIRSPSAAASSWPASSATASRRCSAPSSSSSRGAAASAAARHSAMPSPGWSRTRRQLATAGTSEAGWRTGSSGMNTTSAAGLPRRIASMASLVFPAPPGPTRLTSRDVSMISPSSVSSVARPMKLDWATGSPAVGGPSAAALRLELRQGAAGPRGHLGPPGLPAVDRGE